MNKLNIKYLFDNKKMSLQTNIFEIKTEYTNCLIKILAPEIYIGLKSIYNKANQSALISNETYIIFQFFLKNVQKWDKFMIQEELLRIKKATHTENIFDNLVKVVMKSKIIFLTQSQNSSNYKEFYETLDTNNFLHQCYINCANAIYENPILFEQQNEQKILQIIADGINDSIMGFLPMELILIDYLNGEYVENDIITLDEPITTTATATIINNDDILDELIVSIAVCVE